MTTTTARHPSLRNRLLLLLLPFTVVVWIGVALVIYSEIQHEVDELIDAQLVQSARVLLNLLSHELYEEEAYRGKFYDETRTIPVKDEGTGHRYEQKIAFQMWVLPNRLGLKSQGAPSYRMSDLENGFSDRYMEGKWWRVYALTDPEMEIQMQVAEGSERRAQLRDYIALRTLVPVVISLPLLGLLIWFGVGRAMQPLRKLAAAVAQRHPNHLDPVEGAEIPVEAKTLVDALNGLFVRLQRAFDSERRFTADAAHELRTPLAALRTQAQVASRATNDEARRQALQQVIHGVDRATRLAQQLLTLARIDPESRIDGDQAFGLEGMLSQVAAEIAPAALEKNIDLSLNSGYPGAVKGSRDMLAILVRNLLDNAVKYTPRDGAVEVSTERQGDHIVLRVDDSGPGIPQEDREQVFERFYRRLGNEAPGSGLGLSIVKRIADLHGARIRLDASPHGGLRVEVWLSGAASG